MERTVIVILGPTGSGKSKLSISLAKKIGGEIVSCDSMQIYRRMDIGTAKISKNEMENIPHHMIDIVEPNEEFSVGEYVKQAKKIIAEIFERNKVPIVVGGTGLYVKALTQNYDFGNTEKNLEIREKYKKILKEKGNEFLFNILNEKNPEIAKKIHVNDTKKIIRALEKIENKKNPEKDLEIQDWEYLIFGLNLPREELYRRINLRTEKMFEDGLENEVSNLIESGVSPRAQSMEGIGYKQVIYAKENNLTREELIGLVQQKTRNYAKRQLTFMRGIENLIWVDAKDAEKKILEVYYGNNWNNREELGGSFCPS